MAKEFKLPDLGEGIHEGEVLSVLVSVGDAVKEGDLILEVETDKAAVEIPSPFTGVVKEILVKVGDVVEVGDVLMSFDLGEGAEPVKEQKPKEKRAEEERPAKETPPSEGKVPSQERPSEEAAPEEGKLEEEKELERAPRAAKAERPGEAEKREGPVPASPATRRLARELGVDLRKVEPSGPKGLVTAEDVRTFAEKGERRKEAPPTKEKEMAERRPVTAKAPSLPDFSKWGPVERVPLRSIRRATAKQMALAWSQIPHVSNQGMVDVTKLEALRQKHKSAVEKTGGRLSYTVFALKAVAGALKAYPRFNATLDVDAGEIVLKHYYHIGVAADTDEGLVVPVVRDVDRKSMMQLSVELKELIERTRARKVTLEEMQGGTFTITNVGPMGGGHFAPIINYPEVAILGMGAAKMYPKVIEKEGGQYEVVPRRMMPIVLCIDHRLLDGADAIAFMQTIIDCLEDPEEFLLRVS
jgi:pyruvate dehydrogenase E2 component (dihydrolipoamide acetyltransferase)